MGAALVTSSRTGSAGVSGLDVTWHRGQDEGHRPLLWHSMRTPAAMRLVPDSDKLAMYSGNVSTLGSLSRSSDSSDGELPGRHKIKRNSEGGERAGTCMASWPLSARLKSLRGQKMTLRGKNVMLLSHSMWGTHPPRNPHSWKWPFQMWDQVFFLSSFLRITDPFRRMLLLYLCWIYGCHQ